jgi:DNA-binding XRE family transcriptional regulator
MDGKEFQDLRQKLQKTQKQMAQLLGVSLKAVQSYEQGWRSVPSQIERQALFFLALKMENPQRLLPCWEIRHCTPDMREACPAWEFKSGHLCWFINGTICQGKPQKNWKQKIALCKKCSVFESLMNSWGLSSGSKTDERVKKKEGSSSKR